jgi:PEP-CTERM motif
VCSRVPKGTSITVNGVTAAGYYYNGSARVAADLYGRNETDDHGIGACNPGELKAGDCPSNTTTYYSGGGDSNELDNSGYSELIQLTLPSGTSWVSVKLSSLDNNGGSPLEYGQLWGSNSSNPSLFSSGTLIWQFNGGGPIEPGSTIPNADSSFTYLYFQPYDRSDQTNKTTNNDFLVYKAVTGPTTVPEPCTLLLMGTGAAGMLLKRRKRPSDGNSKGKVAPDNLRPERLSD